MKRKKMEKSEGRAAFIPFAKPAARSFRRLLSGRFAQ